MPKKESLVRGPEAYGARSKRPGRKCIPPEVMFDVALFCGSDNMTAWGNEGLCNGNTTTAL